MDDLFQEPPGFYHHRELLPPTFATHQLRAGNLVTVRLVGHSPLWSKGHHLWNAGRTLATHLEHHADELVKARSVLELGAGGGLPSLVASLCGASRVVVTDYPDHDLIENLKFNIDTNREIKAKNNVVAEGYLWGASIEPLLSHLPPQDADGGFDTLILGDVVFNHSEHSKLVATIQAALKHSPASVALVFFTPYRPWLLAKDLAFFDLARDAGLVVNKTLEVVMDKVMFEEDPGVRLCLARFSRPTCDCDD